MRHNKKFNHLGRTKAHRDAMLSDIATFFDSSQKNLYHVGQSQSVESVR